MRRFPLTSLVKCLHINLSVAKKLELIALIFKKDFIYSMRLLESFTRFSPAALARVLATESVSESTKRGTAGVSALYSASL